MFLVARFWSPFSEFICSIISLYNALRKSWNEWRKYLTKIFKQVAFVLAPTKKRYLNEWLTLLKIKNSMKNKLLPSNCVALLNIRSVCLSRKQQFHSNESHKNKPKWKWLMISFEPDIFRLSRILRATYK